MCAATADPLRCENVSFHVSVVPASVALNDPPALTGTPRGFGTSSLLFSFALNCIGLAECPARATAATIPARPSSALDTKANLVRIQYLPFDSVWDLLARSAAHTLFARATGPVCADDTAPRGGGNVARNANIPAGSRESVALGFAAPREKCPFAWR
jgi:hypothetical protein